MVREYDELADILEAINARVFKENREDTLDALLLKWGFPNLVEDQKSTFRPLSSGRIVVIGESTIAARVVVGVAEEKGFDRDRLDLHLEYDDAKQFAFEKLQYDGLCAAILVGPMPHSTPGKGDFGSVIAAMEQTDGYPPVFRLTAGDELKITKTSLRVGLDRVHEFYHEDEVG